MILVQVLVTLLLPPVLLGVINRVKARFAGRRGAPILQPWWDLLRLFRKGTVLSRTTTWVFLAGPVVAAATAFLATLLLPMGAERAPIAFAGDLVLFAVLFGLGRFFTVLAALDTGSAFEGMGAAREVTFASLAEPALFIGLLVGARLVGDTSLTTVLGGGALPWSAAGAPMVLVSVSLLLVLLAENSRIPFDDPNTHLELTMIHEVMVLDHSGPAFGLVLYGAAIKLFAFAALLVRLLLPLGDLSEPAAWAAFVAGLLGVATTVGIIESTLARLRLIQVPRLLVSACLLSIFGLILVAR